MNWQIFLRATKYFALSAMVVTLFGIGCAKKSDTVQPDASVTSVPDPNGSRGPDPNFGYSGGASATFVPDSLTVMNTYVAVHPLNQPSKFQINVNLSNVGRNRGDTTDVWGGSVQISYYDNGNFYNGYFTSGSGTVGISKSYSGVNEAEFNQWFGYNGQRVFHGFFQDQYGAIVLVIDESLSNGDGGISSEVNGSIYFKNFGQQNCAMSPPFAASCGQSALKCWFTENGPFDCRAFMVNGLVNTTSALTPANGYTRLGRFSGLNYKAAFGLQ